MKIVAVVGATGAGKSTVARVTMQLWSGSISMTMSDLIRREVMELGTEPNRSELATHALSQRQTLSPVYWTAKALQEAEAWGIERLVLEGLRTTMETHLLRYDRNALLIGVRAPEELRFQRVRARPNPLEPQSDEELRRILKEDWFTTGECGWNIPGCLDMCHHLIDGQLSVEHNSQRLLNILHGDGFELDQDRVNEILGFHV